MAGTDINIYSVFHLGDGIIEKNVLFLVAHSMVLVHCKIVS